MCGPVDGMWLVRIAREIMGIVLVVHTLTDVNYARLTHYSVSHLFWDQGMPLFVREHEEIRPLFSTHGTEQRKLYPWDQALVPQYLSPSSAVLSGQSVFVHVRPWAGVYVHYLVAATTANQLAVAKRTTLHVATGIVVTAFITSAVTTRVLTLYWTYLTQ